MRDYKNKSRKLARQRYWEENNRDSYSCPDCGRSESQIVGAFEVHHKNGEPMDNRPKNHVALCRVCHMLREDKKPSKEHIKNLRSQLSESDTGQTDTAGTPSVYLAGSMDHEDSEHQTWRSSVAERGDSGTYRYTGSTPIAINSPTEVSYSHGAGPVAGVASDDMSLIDESDALLAYIERADQVGTITEIVYAVTSGMPALVLFDETVAPGPDSPPSHGVGSGVEFQFESPVYWFLINFLTRWGGLDANVTASVVSGRDEIKHQFVEWNWHKQAAESILETTTAD